MDGFVQASEPCTTWHCADIKAMCIFGFYIIIRRAYSHSSDDEIGITDAMMGYGFPLPITNDIANLFNCFDVCLEQPTSFSAPL